MWEHRVTEFLEGLATGNASPAAGAAVSLTGACAAALVLMVGNLTTGRERFQAVDEEVRELLLRGKEAMDRLLVLGEEDAALFREPRRVSIPQATRVPLEIALVAARVAGMARRLVEIGNPVAKGDAQVGFELALAAVEGALAAVDVNLGLLSDSDFRREAIIQRDEIRGEVTRLREQATSQK